MISIAMILKRTARARRGRVIPRRFRHLCFDRFVAGKIDWSQALDYCELNPSPAARVAASALRRWRESRGELERLANQAAKREVDALSRNLGTLQRIGLVAPLLGLFGSLASIARVLADGVGQIPIETAIGASLTSITAGVALAIVVLVAYDGLCSSIERLAAELEQIGLRVTEAMLSQAEGSRPHERYARGDSGTHGRPYGSSARHTSEYAPERRSS
jgi:biopolymer transport protein ExbB